MVAKKVIRVRGVKPAARRFTKKNMGEFDRLIRSTFAEASAGKGLKLSGRKTFEMLK